MKVFKIKKLYYSIWADAIVRYQKRNPTYGKKYLIFNVLLLISAINAITLTLILVWKRIIMNSIVIATNNFYISEPERFTNGTLYFAIFVCPLMLLNYLLVFRKDHYLIIIEKYSTPKKNYGQIYIISVLILNLVTAIIYGVISGTIK